MELRLNRSIRWIHVNDGLVILEPSSGQILDLNAEATELWDQMRLGHAWTVEAGATYLATCYLMPYEQAESIVTKFLQELEAGSVISRVS